MKTEITTNITLDGRPATLTFDRHARFRYGQRGGNLNALLSVPGQDYFQSVILIWSAADEATRKNFPDPSLLVDHIPEKAEDQNPPIFAPALSTAIAAGWFELTETPDAKPHSAPDQSES